MLSSFLYPVVICYHHITEAALRLQVRFLKRHFEIVPLRELVAQVFEHDGAKPRRLAALTMDDCYENDFANAKAVCESEKVHCTFFLPVQYALAASGFWPQRLKNLFDAVDLRFVDEAGVVKVFPSDDEKQKLLRHFYTIYNQNDLQTHEIEKWVDRLYETNGVTEKIINPILSIKAAQASVNQYVSFESHSQNHPKLYLCSAEEVGYELATSKFIMSQYFGEESRCFCYPYGSERHIGESWKQVSGSYDYGFTLKRGVIHTNSHRLLLPRIDLYEKDNLMRVACKIILSQGQY